MSNMHNCAPIIRCAVQLGAEKIPWKIENSMRACITVAIPDIWIFCVSSKQFFRLVLLLRRILGPFSISEERPVQEFLFCMSSREKKRSCWHMRNWENLCSCCVKFVCYLTILYHLSFLIFFPETENNIIIA